MSFLDKIVDNKNKGSKVDPESKIVHDHDRWDKRAATKIYEEIKNFRISTKDLGTITPTAYEAMIDSFFAMFKPVPRLKETNQVRPSWLINKTVMETLVDLKEYELLRGHTIGDPVDSAIACTDIEPTLKVIFDKLDSARAKAEEIEALIAEGESLDDTDTSDMSQEEIDALLAQMDELAQQVKSKTVDLENLMECEKPEMKESLQQALKQANQKTNTVSQFHSWGLGQGDLQRMDPDARMKLADRLATDKFAELARIIGRMQTIAVSAQLNKANRMPEEIYDIERGDDLHHMLPVEYLSFCDEWLELDWMRRFTEKDISQYALKGSETVRSGPVICVEDGSGSMMFNNGYLYAKAVGLALLKVALMQKRGFYGIQFSGPGDYVSFDFDTEASVTSMTMQYHDSVAEYSGVEAIIEYADKFLNGGPLRVDQRVVTPDGWKPIGEMVVGDYVYGPDGLPTKVLEVKPQGVLNDVYKVTFRNGAEVVCDGRHLWTVFDNYNKKFKTITLNEIIRTGIVIDRPSGVVPRYHVPNADPIVLDEKELPLHPYLLGYLLGDGTLGGDRSVSIASSETEFPWIDVLPDGITVTTFSEPCVGRSGSYGLIGTGRGKYSKNKVIDGLKELGLYGVRGADKFVPEMYLWGSIDQRVDLLAGLLDSDGNIYGAGFEFCNSSLALCEAVAHLARSLGGNARIVERKINRNDPKKDRSNEKPNYRVFGFIHESLSESMFRLSRYTENRPTKRDPYNLTIKKIEPLDPAECLCIRVDREDGLFLTEGMIVTHNTDFQTPLNVALDLITKEFEETGRVNADIVFITDGQAHVRPDFLEKLHEARELMQFNVYGIAIGAEPESEPLNEICAGKVIRLKELLDSPSGEFSELFGNI